jgi:undecaprenyl diphosphate synthase
MTILGEVIHRQAAAMHREGVRLRHLGRLDRLPAQLQRSIREVLELTEHNTHFTLGVAFDYGGREEILAALRQIIADGVRPEQVDEALFHRYLYTAGLPDPDLIIRTAGEQRLSNFLLWQSAYSEYYCTPALWPDFDEAEVDQALLAYSRRQRRFGGLQTSPDGTSRDKALGSHSSD